MRPHRSGGSPPGRCALLQGSAMTLPSSHHAQAQLQVIA
jgi:hypothetical protein